jgi:hypothetical protein
MIVLDRLRNDDCDTKSNNIPKRQYPAETSQSVVEVADAIARTELELKEDAPAAIGEGKDSKTSTAGKMGAMPTKDRKMRVLKEMRAVFKVSLIACFLFSIFLMLALID